MRIFSELEKNILSDIAVLSYEKSNVMDMLSKHALIDKGLILDFSKNTMKFLVPLKEKEAIGEILESTHFILFLEKENLIYLHSNYENLSQVEVCISHNINQKYIDDHSHEFGIQPIPTNFLEIIKRLHNSYIIPTTQLKDLVKNDFKSYEQLRHEDTLKTAQKQHDSEMRFTKIALVISIFALFVAIVLPNYISTKIDKPQFDLLMEKIDNR